MTDDLDMTISIINFRTGALTKAAAQSALAEIGDLNARVVIVDNASGDGSAEYLHDWISGLPAETPIELVLTETNTGFSGGHNRSLTLHRAKYYVLLNSDAYFATGCIETLVDCADQFPDFGIFAPKLVSEDATPQESCFRFPSPLSEFSRGACTGFVSRILQRFEVAIGTEPNQSEIDWVSFACVLLNGKMVRQIGLMDEGYFLYFEDAEFALRAKRSGWRAKFVPDAVAIHHRGGSGPVKSLAKSAKRLPRYYYASRTRFMRQAYGLPGPWFANVAWQAGRLVAQLRRLAARRPYPAVQSEGRDIWTNILQPLGPSRGANE